ncbi:MAG: hypothetical protein ACRD1Q_12155 [Vicinamibacterales bacterium]
MAPTVRARRQQAFEENTIPGPTGVQAFSALKFGEGFTPCVCQQPVEAAGKMSEVKANRCRASRSTPELAWRQRRDEPIELLGNLKKRVSGRHELSGNSWHGPAKPDFRWRRSHEPSTY